MLMHLTGVFDRVVERAGALLLALRNGFDIVCHRIFAEQVARY